MDPDSGFASMNFSISQASRYFIQYRVISDPPDYDLTVISDAIDVLDAAILDISDESIRDVSLTFNYDYNTYVLGQEDYFLATVANELVSSYAGNVSFTNFTVSSGNNISSYFTELRLLMEFE